MLGNDLSNRKRLISKHTDRELAIPWPRFDVLDTAVLARRVLLRDEVPNVKRTGRVTLA